MIIFFKSFVHMSFKTLSVQDCYKEIFPENIKLFELKSQPVAWTQEFFGQSKNRHNSQNDNQNKL